LAKLQKGCNIRTIIFILFFNFVYSDSDTIRVATYNVLNYSISNSSQKSSDFRAILDEIDPDVLIVQEMLNSSGASYFLSSILNYNGNEYSAAPFVDGYDTDNMLYYKADKVYLIASDEIGTALRDINEYTLQVHNDIFNIYSVHLKASQGYSSQRLAELQELHDELNTLHPYIVGGDFNIYNSSESGYSYMLNEMGLMDPISTPGNWHNNSSYSFVHTQSTRSSNESDGGASGGMDDRFDQLLISEGINYINDSYVAYGNDGNHFNLSINSGNNSAVSNNIANALYNASDHLPVYMDIVFDIPANSIQGDLNEDGVLNILDVVILVNYVLYNNYDSDDVQLADMNDDGILNILDIVGLVNTIIS